jgi:transcription initiation factor TFIID subunit 1
MFFISHAFSGVLLLFCSKELANFHWPKALWYPHDNEVAVKEQWKLPIRGPMKIIVKSLRGKGIKLHVDVEETVSSVKVKASKKLGCHFSFLSGYVLCLFSF